MNLVFIGSGNKTEYVVDGIVSGGIHRGFQKAWEDSPLQITYLAVQYDSLTIDLEPRK